MVAAPFSLLGSLSAYESQDETPHIGTRFPSKSTQLSRFLTAHNADELITDLAHLVSQRGVVFFTAQDLTHQQQHELGDRMGKLSGRPATSKLHRHPISEGTSELGAETSVIDSKGWVEPQTDSFLSLIADLIPEVSLEPASWRPPERAMGGTLTSPSNMCPRIMR